jgi:hypothetical protein
MGNQGLEARIALMEERLALLEGENRRLSKANDVHEIQNVMSLHEYYHSACMHQEELDAIWAQEADDVAFEEALFQARFVGLEAIRTYYVDFMRNTLFRSALGLTRSLFPQLKDDPEDELAFGLSYMHTLTTPVIEVAEDGNTAKGVWISPGFITMPTMEKLQAYWHWDRYGVDFIREGGKWKIWHFFVGREFTTPYEKSWVDSALDGEEPYAVSLDLFKQWPGFTEPHAAQLNPFDSYSPFKVASLKPRLPEPYRTFSETFSY